jgi:hypothetical protein
MGLEGNTKQVFVMTHNRKRQR